MVSEGGGDGKKSGEVAKSSLSIDEQKKVEAKRALKREIHDLLTQEAKWTQSSTAFDHLPPHEKPFPIEPFRFDRERLPFKMSDEDRARRKAWLHAQELSDREPIRVPELEYMIYNPFRRLYRLPTDRLFNALAPILGEHRVPAFRWIVPKIFLAWVGGCIAWYHFKYNRVVSIIFKYHPLIIKKKQQQHIDEF